MELNSASARVAEGGAPEALPPAAEDYLTAFDRLIAVGLEMAGRTEVGLYTYGLLSGICYV